MSSLRAMGKKKNVRGWAERKPLETRKGTTLGVRGKTKPTTRKNCKTQKLRPQPINFKQSTPKFNQAPLWNNEPIPEPREDVTEGTALAGRKIV